MRRFTNLTNDALTIPALGMDVHVESGHDLVVDDSTEEGSQICAAIEASPALWGEAKAGQEQQTPVTKPTAVSHRPRSRAAGRNQHGSA